MKNTDIESLLRGNKPQVMDNPTFLLEVQQKMCAVDGIKSEVDRQRRYGRRALVFALIAGLILGGIFTLLAYFYPIHSETLGESILVNIKMALDPWKLYILLFVAGCAVALGVISSRKKENIMGIWH